MIIKKVFCGLSLLVSLSALASPESDQELMSTWINLESQIGHMRESWLDRKASMEQKIDLFTLEQDAIQELLSDASSEKTEVDKERKALLQKQTRLEDEQTEMEAAVDKAVVQMQVVAQRLPPPVKAQWDDKLSALLGDDLTTSEKLESILNLLKISNEFDDRVALNKGVISIPTGDGKSQIVVNQIYLGLSHGWYVSDDGSYSGYGRAGETGWQWWSSTEARSILGVDLGAEEILEVLAVLKNPTNARFLPLPLAIKH